MTFSAFQSEGVGDQFTIAQLAIKYLGPGTSSNMHLCKATSASSTPFVPRSHDRRSTISGYGMLRNNPYRTVVYPAARVARVCATARTVRSDCGLIAPRSYLYTTKRQPAFSQQCLREKRRDSTMYVGVDQPW